MRIRCALVRRAHRTVSVIAAMAFAICLVACSGGGQDIAAKVGDDVITEAEVTAYTADFRADNDLADDDRWRDYLDDLGLTAKTWREQVIGTLSEKKLVMEKAMQLGITADEKQVDEQIEADVESYGGRDEYLAALEAQGTSEVEQREGYEFLDIEQQVVARELDVSDADHADLVQDYIDSSLADRVLRRYSVIVFDLSDGDLANQCLSQLQQLEGDELTARFSDLAAQYSIDADSAARGGDAGWNYGYSLVNRGEYVALDEGELYDKLFEVVGADGETDEYEIMLCTKKFSFADGVGYDDIEDEDLKAYVVSQANAARWSELVSEYVNGLRDAAQVQVREMPAGLPYDVG